jgi:hypothetical protein
MGGLEAHSIARSTTVLLPPWGVLNSTYSVVARAGQGRFLQE